MCGIGGVLGRPTEGFAAFMQDALRHRGPDGQVSWAEGGIILTQTRLAIIDVSDEGTQPFHSRDGRFTVIYNGEIYNHQELRTRHALAAPPCDGAMLPELWAKLGPACLSELRGMFAICVFDRLDRRMWLAVDPLGMKPLYVRRRPAEVAFSSEAMPLAQHFGDSAPEDGAQAIFEAWGAFLPTGRGLRLSSGWSPAKCVSSTETAMRSRDRRYHLIDGRGGDVLAGRGRCVCRVG